MSIRSRLACLERALPRRGEGPCLWPGITVIVGLGEPVPEDTAVCPRCGEAHVQVIVEEIVEAAGEGSLS